MKLILHRANKLDSIDIQKRKIIDGFECDIRYQNNQPVLSHDIQGSSNADNFKLFCGVYKNLDVILNFKETGDEENFILNYEKYFRSFLILDAPFPVYEKLYKTGLGKRIMWRVSEYEKPEIECIKKFNSEWIWLDSFTNYWFTENDLKKYKDSGINICLVSNELQNRDIEYKLNKIIELNKSSLIDSICTKFPEFYINIFG